jgi:hypothetical protein
MEAPHRRHDACAVAGAVTGDGLGQRLLDRNPQSSGDPLRPEAEYQWYQYYFATDDRLAPDAHIALGAIPRKVVYPGVPT